MTLNLTDEERIARYKAKSLARAHKYNKANRGKVREIQKIYRGKNKTMLQRKSRYYNDKINFNGFREKAMERDGNKCVLCVVTNKKHLKLHKTSLEVHHIDGEGRYSKKPNNVLSNLQTLCKKCHLNIHRKML